MITANFEYCPNCGSKFDKPNLYPLKCNNCMAVQYHNSKPTTLGLIVENNKVLMVIRAGEPAKGEYHLPGGFLEFGELPEEGVVRELNEELGVDAKIKSFLGFFVTDYLPGIKNLDTVFLAEIVSGTPKADDDAAAFEWVDLARLPSICKKMSLQGPRIALLKLHSMWQNGEL